MYFYYTLRDCFNVAPRDRIARPMFYTYLVRVSCPLHFATSTVAMVTRSAEPEPELLHSRV